MRSIVAYLIAGLLCLISVSALAANTASHTTISMNSVNNQGSPTKPLIIYEEPNTTSKVLSTVTSGQTIIPFFEQKGWVKIANPQTGAVGWAQKTSLDGYKQITIISNNPVMQQYVLTQKDKDGNVVKTYRVIEYSNGKTINSQQAQILFQQIAAQQRQLQEHFNQMMVNFFHSVGWEPTSDQRAAAFPVFSPVIVIHEQNSSAAATQPKKESNATAHGKNTPKN